MYQWPFFSVYQLLSLYTLYTSHLINVINDPKSYNVLSCRKLSQFCGVTLQYLSHKLHGVTSQKTVAAVTLCVYINQIIH